MEVPPPFSVPHTVNQYILTEIIGSGGFSVVYKAQNDSTGETVAIKVVKKSSLSDELDQIHLQRELDTMAHLRHDNIVALHDFFADQDHFFLVLDFCQGGSLMDVLINAQKFREHIVASIFKQIVSGINFCHARDVAHRDLKPQNILVTDFPSIKITDFGLCGYAQRDEKMQTFCGSPCYTAPECLSRTKYDGKLADVWSLGVILYELVTCEHPWPVQNTAKMIQLIQKAQYTIPAWVTPALADLIKSMMRLNPRERPTCEAILAHPWLKISRTRTDSALPPLHPSPLSMSAYAASFDRKSEKPDHGIVSPFLGSPPTPQITVPMPRPPRSRSGSSVAQKIQSRKSLGASQPIMMGQLVKRDSMGSGRMSKPPLPLPRRG